MDSKSGCSINDETAGICLSLSEKMFDKVVTPSDVGKLNRLVIPKQHAEKYFPLEAANDKAKGLLLNFQDARNASLWLFRYSYWNSSQSYVITKGWSRFVKDKNLHAGDIVSFHRNAARDRLFIDCRRRGHFPPNNSHPPQQLPLHRSLPWNPMPPYGRGSVVYLGSAAPAMGMGVLEWPHQLIKPQEPQIVFDSIPVVQGKAAAKRLRLFGVNMETAEQQALESQCSVHHQLHANSSSSEEKGKLDLCM